jgi:hypothetical protein
MKKILYFLFFILISVSITAIIYLSFIGLETSKFNNFIINEIKKKDPGIKIELEKIKIKLDLKKIQLFLSTNNPKITYREIKIPISEIKIYSKINKILQSKMEINRIIFAINKFKTPDVQKIAIRIKPSNFKTYLLNNLNGGEIEKALFDISTNKDFKLVDYKASGSIKKVDAKIASDFTIRDISFNFIADKNLTLINSINASYEGILVSNGSINIQKKEEIEIKGKFNSKFSLEKNQLNKLFSGVRFVTENEIESQGSLLHDFNLKINNNFKIVDYNYKSNGYLSQTKVILKEYFKSKLIEKPIKKIFLEKVKLETIISKKNKSLLLEGFYSFNSSNYKKFQVKHNIDKKNKNYLIDLDLSENIFLDIINFRSDSKKKSNIKIDLKIKNKKFIFDSINFTEGKNNISIKGLIVNNKKELDKLMSVNVLTFNKNKENNNFIVNIKKKISVSGKAYDASNLVKVLSENNKSNPLKNFNKEIKMEIKKFITKEVLLNNFNLIGSIQKGKFNQISAKSEFLPGEYLDISLKKTPNNKKILEVYSDVPRALLSDYKFFEGIIGGKLLYNSIINVTGSTSKLKIENFKVIKAPTFAKLLTLADLGGVTDLLSGQGMSFDILEIDLIEEKNVTTIKEILALGSSLSLHMEGYIEKTTGLISLSGTLVPAKTLNSLVSKIPVVGNILVGPKVGEGIFGVSFKIKGLPGKVKTTVNPVKTITPRFIMRALEKLKKN